MLRAGSIKVRPHGANIDNIDSLIVVKINRPVGVHFQSSFILPEIIKGTLNVYTMLTRAR